MDSKTPKTMTAFASSSTTYPEGAHNKSVFRIISGGSMVNTMAQISAVQHKEDNSRIKGATEGKLRSSPIFMAVAANL
jgi:hypothetical protein